MSFNELEDIYNKYMDLLEIRQKCLDNVVSYLNRLNDRAFQVENIVKCDNYVSYKLMDYNIKIQYEISVTKPFSKIEWLNIKLDCNNKIETKCILVYLIDKNGVIKDGESIYNMTDSNKVNRFLIESTLNFLKKLEG